jgi:hypothetical protein
MLPGLWPNLFEGDKQRMAKNLLASSPCVAALADVFRASQIIPQRYPAYAKSAGKRSSRSPFLQGEKPQPRPEFEVGQGLAQVLASGLIGNRTIRGFGVREALR